MFHDEQMLMLLYERMQHAPPLYDFMHRVSLHLDLCAVRALLMSAKTSNKMLRSWLDTGEHHLWGLCYSPRIAAIL